MIYSVFIRWKGNSGFLADYRLLVLKKPSNPSYCALSPHIISRYNRSKNLVFTTKNSQKQGSTA